MNHEVMTVQEVADYLQLNKQTVYRKVRAGQIPAIKIGKVLRFKRDVIDGWLRENSETKGGMKDERERSRFEGLSQGDR